MRHAILLLLLLFVASPARAAEDPELHRFVYSAVKEGVAGLGLPDAVLDRILEVDGEGRPVSFIPGCPICEPAREAFRDSRGAGGATSAPPELLARLGSEDDLERTAALGRLIQELVGRRIAAAGWSDAEAEDWGRRFEAAAAEGQRRLTAQQARHVEAYERMWSCMLCDGASRACKRR